MNLTYEQLLELSEKGANIHVHLNGSQSDDGGGDDLPDDESKDPPTLLIQMLEKEAFKKPSDYNKKGKPIMDKTIPGFRAEAGDIFQVYVEPLVADGSAKYWRIWNGEDGDISMRDWHVSLTRSQRI
ncbi:MAG: hypothetical protein N2D54_11870 [Chloroflexota bacterium]